MALSYPDDPAVTVAAGPFRSSSEGYLLDGEVLVEPLFTTAVHDGDGGVISATPLTVPLVGGSMVSQLLASNPSGYSRLVEGVRAPLVFFYRFTVRLRDRDGRTVPAPEPVEAFLGADTTRVDLDVLRPVGRDQGVLVVRPAVESIAGLTGHISAEQVVALIGPDVLTDAIARALANPFTPAYSASAATAKTAMENVPTLAPTGRWDFTHAPTVAGQPLASGGSGAGSAGPPPVLVLDDATAVPAGTAAGTLVVMRPASGSTTWRLAGIWDGSTTAVLRTSGSGAL